jgi:Zn-dependent protease
MVHPTPNAISFKFFGFPTTIQPFFWLTAAIITAIPLGHINNDMPIWFTRLFLGMLGVLLSILVHELGHAFTFRHVFRTPCAIVLHGFGGVALPLQHYSRGYGFKGAMANGFLSFSGPLAGFVFAVAIVLLLEFIPSDRNLDAMLLRGFLDWTALISIIWGIFNLLPIYPMDGGHISREIFLFFFPRRGIEFSLIVSMLTAALLAVAALQSGNLFITFLFAYFAYQNYQEMTFGAFRR